MLTPLRESSRPQEQAAPFLRTTAAHPRYHVSSHRSPHSVCRAKSFTEGTTLFCRLPSITFFYCLEAVHLKNLLRFRVRRVGKTHSFHQFFTVRRNSTKFLKNRKTLPQIIPLRPINGFRGMPCVKKNRKLCLGGSPKSLVSFLLPRHTICPRFWEF